MKKIFPGVWKVIQDQEIYFLKTFEIALRKMNKKLRYVSDIMFAYFHQQKCGDAENGDYLGGSLDDFNTFVSTKTIVNESTFFRYKDPLCSQRASQQIDQTLGHEQTSRGYIRMGWKRVTRFYNLVYFN